MCGRYELHSHPAAIALAFGLAYPPHIHPRYNIAPMQQVPIVRLNTAGDRELVQVRWGLVPRRARDPSIGARMINARGETVATKPTFGTAFRRHRCLLPADGFYEWQVLANAPKQPMRVGMKDGSLFGLAGLYERWLSPEGEPLDTCTILTTQANALLHPVHERMPVIVPPDAYEQWLDPAAPEPEMLIAPYPAQPMTFWPVSMRVNSVKNDAADLIEPRAADDDAPAQEPLQVELPVESSDDETAGAPRQTQLF
jgi:putative SOS response-associated peptidase YedK